DGRRMSTGRRLSANIGEIGAAIGAQLGIKPSSRPSSPGGRRASDASLPGSVPDVTDEILKEKQKRDEQERKKIEEYDIKVKMHDKGGKATEIYKALRTDPSQFSGTRLKLHHFISWWGFDTGIGLIIISNAITIGWETQVKSSVPLGCTEQCDCANQLDMSMSCQTPPEWIAALDYCFYGVYVVELVARVGVYGIWVFKSHWVKFDFFLVLTATADLFVKAVSQESVKILMLVRMLRLARLARAVRLMVQFKTLWQLVQGLFHSLGTLLWTFLLISILMYVGAIVGMELIRLDEDLPLDHPYNKASSNNFSDFIDALMTLLQIFSLDSIGAIYKPIIKHRFFLLVYFMSVLLLLSIALMNLVTAVMVNSSLDQATQDKEALKAWESARRAKQIDHLKDMFLLLDEDGSGELTLDEINGAPEETQQQLKEIVATDDLRELFDMLDYDGSGTIGVEEFCDGILKATTRSTGILELGRLVKQCSDTLQNTREAIAILQLEEVKEFCENRKGQIPQFDAHNNRINSASASRADSRPASANPMRRASNSKDRRGSLGGLGDLGGSEDAVSVKEGDINRLDSKVNRMESDLGEVRQDINKVLQMINDKMQNARPSRNASPNLRSSSEEVRRR
ncbi:unnamed protein product, partial [Cladocopium goreaui]